MQVKEAVEEYCYIILQLSADTQTWYMARLKRFADWCKSCPDDGNAARNCPSVFFVLVLPELLYFSCIHAAMHSSKAMTWSWRGGVSTEALISCVRLV